MDKKAQLKRLLKEILGENPNVPFPATVVSVQGQTCTVKIAGGLEVSDVRLKTTVSDESDYFLLTPKINSDVLLLSSDGSLRSLTVIKIDQIEKFEFVQNGLVVEFDAADSKVSIKNDDTSLKDLFGELVAIIRELKVYTAMGPSGTPLPDTMTSLLDFESLFNRLLK